MARTDDCEDGDEEVEDDDEREKVYVSVLCVLCATCSEFYIR